MATSSKLSRFWSIFTTTLAIGAMALVLLPIFLNNTAWPVEARDYLAHSGTEDSGAINLVSAIYLGYRVFDTFGETIVLLVAVLGTMGILSRVESLVDTSQDEENTIGTVSGFALTNEKRRSHALRTHLLEVVTGKIGPIVLLFGFYVMLYGHVSPGGGFQGGVIVASGIVFLALGNPQEGSSGISNPEVLVRLESVAFLLLIIVFFSGFLVGNGFFGNPLESTQIPVGYIVILNAVIGMKVGTSIGFMCIAMMGGGR